MRTRTSLAVCAAMATLALGAVPAAAAPHPAADSAVLTVASAGGSAVAVGDVLSAPLAPNARATFYSTSSGTTGVACATSQFTAAARTNPAAPGSATESLTGQTFSSCTSNVTGVISVQRLSVDHLPYAISVSDATGYPVTISAGSGGGIQATAVLNTWFGTLTCSYQLSGSFAGNADNTAHSLTFTNEHFTKSSGSSLCPADGYFSAAYGPVTDTGMAGSPTVFVN